MHGERGAENLQRHTDATDRLWPIVCLIKSWQLQKKDKAPAQRENLPPSAFRLRKCAWHLAAAGVWRDTFNKNPLRIRLNKDHP